MAQRWDTTAFDKFERLPSGGVKIPATPARVGIQVYTNPDGSLRREYRPASEVFAADSLASLQNAPLTVGHPPGGAVTTRTWKTLSAGHIGAGVGHTETHVTADACVLDEDAIGGVERRELVELSCGYTCDVIDSPGEYDGEKYDAIQTNIRQNHVALLPAGWGRAGPTCSLRLDALDPTPALPAPSKEKGSMKVKVDGKDFEKGSDEHFAALDAQAAALQARADKAEAYARELPKRVERRAKLRTDWAECKRQATMRGMRFDAPEPSADPEATDDGTLAEKLIAEFAPDFDVKSVASVPGPEGALMMLVHMLKAEEAAEPEAEQATDVVGPDPGDANAGMVPAASPGRTDDARARTDARMGGFGEPPPNMGTPQLSAYDRNVKRSAEAWQGGANKDN